jgi:hypothetical protein
VEVCLGGSELQGCPPEFARLQKLILCSDFRWGITYLLTSRVSPLFGRVARVGFRVWPEGQTFPLPSLGHGVPSCDRVAASRVSAPVAWVLTSPRHPLGSGESVVRPGGTRAARQAFPDAITGSGGSLGCSGPGPLLLGCSGPPVPSALGALAGRAVLLVRVGQRRHTH